MDTEALQAFLTQPNDAIISVNRMGKGSQLSPVWFVWDGESFLFFTQKASAKLANIMRDPNISILVNDPTAHVYVTAYGRAEVVESEQYPELWNTISAKYRPAERREQFTAAMQAIGRLSRVVIAFKPEKMVGRTLVLERDPGEI